MTEAGIDADLFRDATSRSANRSADGSWAVRAPSRWCAWFWLGALLMALGAFVTAMDKPRRRDPSARRPHVAREAGCRWRRSVALAVLLAAGVWMSCNPDREALPSPLIGAAPDFSLPSLHEPSAP